MSENEKDVAVSSNTLMSATTLGLVYVVLGFQSAYAQTRDIGPEILIGIQGAPSLGASNAKVTLIEFSDYECPRSGEYFNWTMRQVIDEFVHTGKVKYVYRDSPIESIHPLALKAAEGAYCAGEQGKYWEMHDRFFRNQASLEPKILPLHASMLGLDVPKFQQCLNSGKYTAKIRESVEEGKKAGVLGTPGFFIGLTDPNNRQIQARIYVDGRQPFNVFKEAIERLLSSPSEGEKETSHD
jgi:protein-disulfide isomerase